MARSCRRQQTVVRPAKSFVGAQAQHFFASFCLTRPSAEVLVAPSMLHTVHVRRTLRPDVAVSGQNAWHGGCGAFTGEVAAEQLQDAGCRWVLLGHSERRAFSHESNGYVAEKVKHAQGAGLSVLACVGETLAQRQAGEALATVDEQMRAVMAEHLTCFGECLVVAYEPVWAIGSGHTATPVEVQAVHSELRRWLGDFIGEHAAAGVRLVYGGSVNASNAAELAQLPDVDGFLVGGASLKGPEFVDIIWKGFNAHTAAAAARAELRRQGATSPRSASGEPSIVSA
jgi:triosephosphate isomerase